MNEAFDGEGAKRMQVCSVCVGEEIYGIPLDDILEIVGGARPQPVPLAPDFTAGLVHYRGDVLTTVSLRRVLGMSPEQSMQDLLVLEDAGTAFGLVVDSVREVLTVSSADFEPKPQTLQKRKALFAGAFKLRDGLLVMLETAQLQPMRLAELRESVDEPSCTH